MWSGHQWALGREQGEFSLNRFSKSVFNSFLPPSDFGSSRFAPGLQPDGTEVVDMRRLDDVFDTVTQHIAEPRVFLKVDTQGFDMEVLAGTETRMKAILGLQLEVPFLAVYEGVPSFARVLTDVDTAGFDLTGVFPVTRDAGLRIIEADCLFVARRALTAD
jgi:FkbM family methyltransferase